MNLELKDVKSTLEALVENQSYAEAAELKKVLETKEKELADLVEKVRLGNQIEQ